MLTRGEPRNVGCHVHKLGARLHLRMSALRSSATAAAPLHDRNNQTLITPPPEPQSETPLPRSLLSFKVPTTLIFRALSKVRSLELTCAKDTLVKVRKSKCLTRARDARALSVLQTLSPNPQLSRARARGRAGGRLCHLRHKLTTTERTRPRARLSDLPNTRAPTALSLTLWLLIEVRRNGDLQKISYLAPLT